ncbi:MAG: hypothetical protein QXQ87_04670 [Halobacteria archaeon]
MGAGSLPPVDKNLLQTPLAPLNFVELVVVVVTGIFDVALAGVVCLIALDLPAPFENLRGGGGEVNHREKEEKESA